MKNNRSGKILEEAMRKNHLKSCVAVFALGASIAFPFAVVAQSNAPAPMFSTPASRSTTGAPILNEPSSSEGGIIGSAGGAGRAAPPAPVAAAPKAAPPSTPQPASPAPSSAIVAEKFKDWDLQCLPEGADPRLCQISGKTSSPDGSQVILVMSLAKDLDGKTSRMQMAVPLGIALAEKVEIAVAPSYKVSLPVSRCTPQGCLIEGPAEDALVNAMRQGEKAEVSVATPEGARVPIELSLSGFSSALDALGSQTQ
jgi:invasion protein IalB